MNEKPNKLGLLFPLPCLVFKGIVVFCLVRVWFGINGKRVFFLPCRFVCSELHSCLVSHNKHPAQAFAIYTLPSSFFSPTKNPVRETYRIAPVCSWWLKLRGEVNSQYFAVFLKGQVSVPPVSEAPGALIRLEEPLALLYLEFLEGEAQEPANWITPWGKFLRTTSQGNVLCP